jgi:hypothetical protein
LKRPLNIKKSGGAKLLVFTVGRHHQVMHHKNYLEKWVFLLSKCTRGHGKNIQKKQDSGITGVLFVAIHVFVTS